MTQQIQPIFIMPEGTTRTSGRSAQKGNIAAAKAVADTVRTTLGPKGMDKMLVDNMGDVVVTNDGVTILEEMNIEHPAAKMIVEVARTQEDEVGDGTTTAVVIAGELLDKAEDLIDKAVHPTVVARGYRLAADKALKILNEISREVTENDEGLLKKISITAMTGKGAEHAKEHLSELSVKAVKSVMEKQNGKVVVDKENIKIEKRVGGSVEDSELVSGIILDKEKVHPGMPDSVKNAKVALIDSAIEIKNTETDAKIQITDPSQLQGFMEMEEKIIRGKVDKVTASGATVVFCQKGIDDLAQHFLSKKGVFAVRRVSQSDMEKLARATGAKIVTNLDDLSSTDLGTSGLVEAKRVGNEDMTFVRECKNAKAVTLLIRGGTEHVVAEIKRAVEDSIGDLAVSLVTGKIVAGAGATEIELSIQLRKYAQSLSGREQLAVNAFADAVEVIPRTLAENSGIDPIDVMTELKAAHDKGNKTFGIDVFGGKSVDAWKEGIVEPLKIKLQAISSASEVAIMVLRIDDVIGSGKEAGPRMPSGGMPEY
ncbi:TCP-1/cpn60 chaperonin family protein [Candidatus Woesearchaeota archaeon]|nr:TCP-1/cpn60 chaperonin family protein [Candidatus Woesearchaeota archaeon]